MEKMPESTLVALAISNVRIGFSSPTSALATLASRGYFFIGGTKEKEEHIPGYNQFHLDINIGEWVYNVEKGAERTVTITNIGGIAILSSLFGSLDSLSERYARCEVFTKKHPPHFAWREKPREMPSSWPAQFEYYVRPELITEAQRHPENLEGAIHIVKPDPHLVEPIGQGIYNSFGILQTLGIMRVNGTALFNLEVEPDNFDDIEMPYLYEPKDKKS